MSNARCEWMVAGDSQSRPEEPVAIVGMAVDLPGAPSINRFWDNLRGGIESIGPVGEEALLAAGETPERIHDRNYVPVAAPLKGFDEFDAEFFGFSAREAAILDPQHRKFMEVAWGALENAGHVPERFGGPIGVYAGCGMGSYFYFNICSNPDLVDDVGMFLLRHTGNDKDFLSTRVSHILDLKGPSLNIQTACSTSLVAVHYACDALRRGDCDMALAGGVTIELPQGRGYLFKENEILSPDGHCHAFDHRARGTVFGSGAGCVALRRLGDAVADGDHIWAVIRGSAVNNDGAAKASYLAPSVDGQAAAVEAALERAAIGADSVDYVECHGTGTYLGDPIEVSALTEAFRGSSGGTSYCGIGSVKTNIGHLDTAAGVASLVKTTLAITHGEIPPSLSYEAPNPAIDFAGTPFYVNDRLRGWDRRGTPRRAGVNSLGVGGTNAFAVLEEAPERAASEAPDWPFHVLCVSGRTQKALEANTRALAAHLRARPDAPLADIAWTLKEGRRGFDKRRVVVADTHAEAAALLEDGDARRVFTHEVVDEKPEAVFMFPGGGAQYPGMARDLYETEPVFAEWMDRGLDHLQARLDYDIRAIWLPDGPDAHTAAEERLKRPSVQLPLIMIVEYALAQLWMSWGVTPAALVGHSMGENTAACLAGVMRFEDGIDLVLKRGRLFDTVPPGGMLSVALPAAELEALVGDALDIASVNASELSAVSGPQDRLDAFARKLDEREIEHQRINIDIAAHSRMLDPILGEFRAFLQGLDLHPPQIPVISNRTGERLTDARATDPEYWVEQLRRRVDFGACISRLADTPGRVFLEVGPGKTLSALAQMNEALRPGQVISSLRHPEHEIADDAFFLGVIGRLWACGLEADWGQIWGEARRHRVPLPGYAFQRNRYFIEPGKAAAAAPQALMRNEDMTGWGFDPVWRPRYADTPLATVEEAAGNTPLSWLMFMDEAGLAEAVAQRLETAGHRVVRVVSGDTTEHTGPDRYTLAPEMGRAAYDRLLETLAEAEGMPDRIGHFWLLTRAERYRPGSSFFDRNMQHGFFSLMHLAQALGESGHEAPLHITVVTNGAASLHGEPLPYPEKSVISGPAGVIPREMPGITCATLDIELPEAPARRGPFARRGREDRTTGALAARLLEDLLAEPGTAEAAYRGATRFEKTYAPVPLDPAADAPPAFRDGGTYLITGGFGGIGLTLARDLLTRHGANVVLLTRTALPDCDRWETCQAAGPTGQRLRALNTLESLGGQVMAAAGDVCNREDMRRVKARIEERFGPVTGVIHAAGTIDDAPLMTKSEADVEAVLAPKITGLRVLDTLFPDGKLELMVLCASTSTATRPAGQVDYIAANDYFNAFARARQDAKTRVLAVNWGVWAEIGMAAEAMARRTGEAAGEDWTPAGQPLLDERRSTGRGEVFRSALGAARHWVINGHRTAAGDALLPGTGYAELAAEALAARGSVGPFEIRDLEFVRALDVPDGQSRRVELHLTGGEDALGIDFRGGCRLNGREGTVLTARAQIARLGGQQPPPPIDPGAIAGRCPARESAATGDRLRAPQEAHLDFGTRWHVLRETALGKREGLARLRLPESCRSDPDEGYLLHPGLLDAATGWAMHLVPGYDTGHLWVPRGYRRIRVLRPLPAEIVSWVRLSEETAGGEAAFDLTLAEPDGAVCLEIAGFRMTRLESTAGFGKPAPVAPADIVFDDADGEAAPLSRDEARLAHNIRQGIRPEEGAEALRRALALRQPQVVVSSLDLPKLIEQAAAATDGAAEDGQSFERPDLDGDYLAPRTDTETELAGYWEKLLGISPVGVEDSFFDLGGHSLIAVRLFAMIKKRFGVEFPISVLFEAPTIAGCAELIDAETGGTPCAEDDDAGEKPAAQRSVGFAHLVTLNRGDPERRPLFIVAGMFGNVLNLRHLATKLGEGRPVYGLQARGLISGDAPHATIGEAAADYLAEIRQVQPDGPYLLGGFSGGGITAYEMAHQIEAQGGKVALLALLDTPLPVRPGLTRRDKALIKLQEFRRKGVGYLREWALDRLRWELEKRQAPGGDAAGGFNNHKIEMAFRGAVSRYRLKPWDGPVLLFRPPLDRHWKVSGGNWVSRAREYVFDDNQWTAWAPRTRVIEVTGDHDSMVLDPNVAVLARHLRDEIAGTEQPETHSGAEPSRQPPVSVAE